MLKSAQQAQNKEHVNYAFKRISDNGQITRDSLLQALNAYDVKLGESKQAAYIPPAQEAKNREFEAAVLKEMMYTLSGQAQED